MHPEIAHDLLQTVLAKIAIAAVQLQRLVGNAMEPRACLVAYDAASGRYTVYAPLQGVGGMVGQISHVTGLDKSKILMATQDVGGSFGVRGPAYP